MNATDTLAERPYISLVTFRRDGSEVPVPVWHARVGDELVVFTEARAYKVKRLRRDSRVRVAACDWRGGNVESYFDGQGRIVTDADEEARAYRALHAKYGWQMKLADAGSWLTGRIDGRAVLALSFDQTADGQP